MLVFINNNFYLDINLHLKQICILYCLMQPSCQIYKRPIFGLLLTWK